MLATTSINNFEVTGHSPWGKTMRLTSLILGKQRGPETLSEDKLPMVLRRLHRLNRTPLG